jgi:hypothetical protein
MENVILPNTAQTGLTNSAVTKTTLPEADVRQVQANRESAEPRLDAKPQKDTSGDSVERRMQLLKRIANLYAVSDTRFTIYKSGGEYYTRITNLRDGSVSVIPEAQFLASAGTSSGALIETSV